MAEWTYGMEASVSVWSPTTIFNFTEKQKDESATLWPGGYTPKIPKARYIWRWELWQQLFCR